MIRAAFPNFWFSGLPLGRFVSRLLLCGFAGPAAVSLAANEMGLCGNAHTSSLRNLHI